MPYLLREGQGKGLALYTRCEDVLLVQAELPLLADELPAEHEVKPVSGFLDVDPTFTIVEFKRAYRGRGTAYRKLTAKRQEILSDGWTYPIVDND